MGTVDCTEPFNFWDHLNLLETEKSHKSRGGDKKIKAFAQIFLKIDGYAQDAQRNHHEIKALRLDDDV